MVTSVGNSSTSILTLFRTGADGATDANSETLAKIQQLAKEAEQLKAASSPAQVQGASVATNAWIGASEAARQAAAPPPDTQTATTDAGSGKVHYAITQPIQLALRIQEYNSALIGQAERRAALEDSQARLAAATDEAEIKHLTWSTELRTRHVAETEEILAESPGQIEKYAQWMNSVWNVSGTLLTKNDDGTYGIGIFFVRLKDNDGMTYYSDRNGSIWKNQRQTVAQADSWREAIVTINGKMQYSSTAE